MHGMRRNLFSRSLSMHKHRHLSQAVGAALVATQHVYKAFESGVLSHSKHTVFLHDPWLGPDWTTKSDRKVLREVLGVAAAPQRVLRAGCRIYCTRECLRPLLRVAQRTRFSLA